MARQERTARATKRAAVQADKVIEQAAQKARRSTAARRGTTTPAKPSSPASVDPAAECVRLRDEEGLSWVQIGMALKLPGSKGGAANARKLYDSTGRDHRSAGTVKRHAVAATTPSERKPRTRRPKPESQKAVMKKVRTGAHNVLPLDTPDPEIGAQLAGRLVKWTIDVGKLCGGKVGEGPFKEEEAIVHPDDILITRDEHGNDPHVTFREGQSVKLNGVPSFVATAYRTVRLSSIYHIGG